MNARQGWSRALSVVAASYAAVFLICVAARLTFGFELSWMESGMKAMTDRLAAHQPIYAAPSPSYVPFIYPPLYYVVAHAIDRFVFGAADGSLPAMRLVSATATLGTVMSLYASLERRRALPARMRLALAALPLAFYGRFEFWHDTSRVDSLFVLLTFAAIALLVEGRGLSSALGAGLVGGLAVLTKQPAAPLLAGAAGIVAFAPMGSRRAPLALATAASVVVAGLAALGELGDPWLYYYLVKVPATHHWVARNLILGVGFPILTMPLFLYAAARMLGARAGAPATSGMPANDNGNAEHDDNVGRRWALVFATSTIIMTVLRLKQGASLNFFLPMVPIGVMVAASTLERLGPRRGEPLLLAQFLILLYNPLAAIPTARDWQAGFELLSTLRAVPGDVFLPQFPAYLTRAGKSPVAHAVAVCDLAELRPDLIRAIDGELDAGRFAAAVAWPAGRPADKGCQPAVDRLTHSTGALPMMGGDFFSRGHRSKLGSLYRYQQPAGGNHS